MQISLYKYVEVSSEFSDSVPYVFIASGGLIILLGTFACCCTVKTQPVLLYIVSGNGITPGLVRISPHPLQHQPPGRRMLGLGIVMRAATEDRMLFYAIFVGNTAKFGHGHESEITLNRIVFE